MLEGEAFLLGEALADKGAQPGNVKTRIAPRLDLGHLVGFLVDLRLGLEIRGHQFDHASDQVLDVALGLDSAAIDKPLHQMVRERIDLSFPHRHRSKLDGLSSLLQKQAEKKDRLTLTNQ